MGDDLLVTNPKRIGKAVEDGDDTCTAKSALDEVCRVGFFERRGAQPSANNI